MIKKKLKIKYNNKAPITLCLGTRIFYTGWHEKKEYKYYEQLSGYSDQNTNNITNVFFLKLTRQLSSVIITLEPQKV